MTELTKEIKIAETDYVCHAVSAQMQYKISQKIARYGLAHYVAGLAKKNISKKELMEAMVSTVLAIVQSMPEQDQDFCISEALKKTAVSGKSDPISIDEFTGRIGEYFVLGAQAIGHQLGDFTFFLNLMSGSTAGDQEGTESKTTP